MPESTRLMWRERFHEVYGNLSGQRSVSREMIWTDLGRSINCDLISLIFGLQTYFVLVSDLLANAVLKKSPSWAAAGFKDTELGV